ncbi:MAG: hypothetical protein KZQ96_20755 [Candidatus Thiodiazotropha sp. (ex Lucinoma borealis)]|nr:hypothetical protein [Candidatus Thiodiazotropha sp. (ex Lucinoma borealis)]
MWKNALALFGDRDRLVKLLQADGEAIRTAGMSEKGITLEQVVGRILRQYLEGARRDLVACSMGVSAGRLKTWERLDRISRGLIGENDSRSRYDYGHFEKLAVYIREHHSKDRNLPRTANTIQDYFDTFCRECDGSQCKSSLRELSNDLGDVRDYLDGGGLGILYECLMKINLKEREMVDSAFGLEMFKKPGYETTEKIDDALGNSSVNDISRILEKLRNCMEIILKARAGERRDE